VPFNSVVTRADVQALIPEQVSDVMLQGVAYQSAALNLFTRVQMSTNVTRMPVISALPVAYWVNGDTGLKQTTKQAWANKYLNVEEIAAIVPIPEAVLDDASFDVWGSIRPNLETAVARALDAAVLFGANKPASWPTDIVAGAIAAGNTAARGASTQAAGGVAQDLNVLFGKVEDDGYSVNGVVARSSFKQILRGARDSTGQALADLSAGTLWGENLRIIANGNWPAAGDNAPEAIAGDFGMAILGVRQDVTYKVLDQAALFDDTGTLIYNLPQQDMVALRVVARFAYQVANPLTYDQPSDAARYPFAVLTQPDVTP
jgi:HK97 family phage major capsid protein